MILAIGLALAALADPVRLRDVDPGRDGFHALHGAAPPSAPGPSMGSEAVETCAASFVSTDTGGDTDGAEPMPGVYLGAPGCACGGGGDGARTRGLALVLGALLVLRRRTGGRSSTAG